MNPRAKTRRRLFRRGRSSTRRSGRVCRADLMWALCHAPSDPKSVVLPVRPSSPRTVAFGENNVCRGPLARTAFEPDSALVRFHNALGARQAQPATTAGLPM